MCTPTSTSLTKNSSASLARDANMTSSFATKVDVHQNGTLVVRDDWVAPEEPLEIQIHGSPLAVLMRTPGNDLELVSGFLLSERIVESFEMVESIRHCTAVTSPESEDNVVRVVLKPEWRASHSVVPRNFYASSSCGVCGKATIEEALRTTKLVTSSFEVASSVLQQLPARLRQRQPMFTETGGLHACGLFDAEGTEFAAYEDVGRHNAVDKVLGCAARRRLNFSDKLLIVSGRVSFEIVQKASAVGISLVAGISAPSSLAIRFGEALGVTVVGFLRGSSTNVYSRKHRVR